MPFPSTWQGHDLQKNFSPQLVGSEITRTGQDFKKIFIFSIGSQRESSFFALFENLSSIFHRHQILKKIENNLMPSSSSRRKRPKTATFWKSSQIVFIRLDSTPFLPLLDNGQFFLKIGGIVYRIFVTFIPLIGRWRNSVKRARIAQ